MDDRFNPKVSIIIPVYNGANFLEEAIESALKQTYKNIEIIIVNDGSNDQGETERIAMKYIDKIKYYYKENGGVATALNLAIEKMTGEYFSWLSHDDLYYDDKIEKQINFIKENKLEGKKIFLFADYSIIDENGNLIEECKKNHKEIEEKVEYSLLRGHVNGITVLIPKKAFDECGRFDESLKCTQDYDLWKKIMKQYKIVHQPEIISKTRIHGKRDTVLNPRVVSEGNQLWVELIEDVTDKRKTELEGSILKYYQEMSKFLKNTPYSEAKKHCDEKIEKINKQIKEDILCEENKRLKEQYLKVCEENKSLKEQYLKVCEEKENLNKKYLQECEKERKLIDELQVLNSKYIENEKQINNILNSKSWKVSAPLRKLKMYINKLK